jgi:hypothetical protein
MLLDLILNFFFATTSRPKSDSTVIEMAKGARASTKKANNGRLKAGVFGPVESARNERLSAKLLELASQPKPKKDDVVMDVEGMIRDHLTDSQA